MFRTLRNLSRLSRIGLTFARYGAVDGLEPLGLPPPILTLADFFRARDLPERPGQRLAAALTGLAERLFPRLRRLRPVAVVRQFEETVRIEMDLRLEAAAAAELAQNFAGDTDFRVPKVDWTRTSRRVLTTERVAGLPVDERAAI